MQVLHLAARMARSTALLVALLGLAALGAANAQGAYPPPARGLNAYCAIQNRTTNAWACNLGVNTPTACEVRLGCMMIRRFFCYWRCGVTWPRLKIR